MSEQDFEPYPDPEYDEDRPEESTVMDEEFLKNITTVVYPPELLDNRAKSMYDRLREVNGWLPDAQHVTAHDPLVLTFGINEPSTITLTMYITLPEVLA